MLPETYNDWLERELHGWTPRRVFLVGFISLWFATATLLPIYYAVTAGQTYVLPTDPVKLAVNAGFVVALWLWWVLLVHGVLWVAPNRT